MSSMWRSWRFAPFVIALALATAGRIANAATFENLYSVTVARDPAAADQRAAAERAAMAKLLIRVTGRRDAALDPLLAPLLATPSAYLSSYGLDRQGRSLVGFSRARVEQTLTSLGIPVWGGERPLTLLWIAVDDGAGGRALLGAVEAGDRNPELTPATSTLLATVRTELGAVADERGLPVVLPLLDLQDLGLVSFTDVWGGFEDRVLVASQRYGADAVLIGRVRPGIVGTAVDWLFVNGVERQGVAGAAVRDGLDAAADRYAAELRTVGEVGLTSITIRQITTSADYGRALGYLERQSILETVDVESFSAGTLILRVAARGDPRVLGRVLALGGVLRPVPGAEGGPLVFELTQRGAP